MKKEFVRMYVVCFPDLDTLGLSAKQIFLALQPCDLVWPSSRNVVVLAIWCK